MLALYKQECLKNKASITPTGPDQAFYMPFGLNELPQPQLPSAFGFCTTWAAHHSISAGLHREAPGAHISMVRQGLRTYICLQASL